MPSMKYKNANGEWERIAGGTGVVAFNGRAGAVKPAQGDYTAEMVGADAQGSAEEALRAAKEYADQIAASGGGIAISPDEPEGVDVWIDTSTNPEGGSGVVASFNGRSGIVVPQTGDYTAEMVGARPDTWMPSAADVGARPDTWMPSASDVGAAPAGYGLGGSYQLISDANSATTDGKYATNDSTLNLPVEGMFGVLEVSTYRNDKSITQVFHPGTSGWQYCTFKRHCVSGTWSDWEWVNPYMSLGVEYRTTERIGGKAVYKRNNNGVIQYRLDGETEWKNYNEVIGAAPAGYGLGEIAGVTAPSSEEYANDANMCIKNGWWRASRNTPNDIGWANIWVFANGGDVYQTAYCNKDASGIDDSVVARRVCSNGVWREWEYDNPPMITGTEYRTTERIGDKAVYKKLVDGVIQYRLDGETEWKLYGNAVGAAPAYTYGTEDLTAGTSELETGKLYFVYE